MYAMRLLAISVLCLTALMPRSASAQLLFERVEGNRRTCYYQPDRTVATTASASTERRGALGRRGETPIAVRLDSWKKCPATAPATPQQAQESIPAFATLSAQRDIEGKNTCVYTYEGRDYSRTMAIGRSCTYTPSGF